MRKSIIFLCSLLLIITGCSNNTTLSNNKTLVWKLSYTIDKDPFEEHYYEDPNDNDTREFIMPKDYNTEVIKEFSAEKNFDTLSTLNSYELDDGLIALATSHSQKATLTKWDLSGKVVWEEVIDVAVNSYPTSEITVLNNGNILFAMLVSYQKGILFCYNQNGQQEWKYSYEDNSGSYIKYIFEDKSGNILCGGLITQNDSYENDVVITKLSTDGEFIDEAFLGGEYSEYLEGATYSESTGLVITGWSYSDDGELIKEDKGDDLSTDYIASIDESLTLNWVYNPENQIGYGYNQLQIENGFIIISGGYSYDDSDDIGPCYHILNNKGELVQESKIKVKSFYGHTAIGLTSENKVVLAFNTETGSKILIKDFKGKTLKELNCELSNPKKVIPTNKGGFIVEYDHPIGYLPRMPHLTPRLEDTVTVLSSYDKNGKLMWQKTYDDCQVHVLTDYH